MNGEELIMKNEKLQMCRAGLVPAQENRTKLIANGVGARVLIDPNKNNHAITLIALIITIIILLILAGVTINVLIGENGLFNIAKRVGDEYEKAAIKEEIETTIINIKAEKIANSEELTIDILKENLPNKLKDITVEKDDEGQIVGEYKGYDYIITKEYEVIIEKSVIKPTITYILSDETIGIDELTITLKATISEGNITKIIKPDGNYEENINEVQYKVTQNGKYKFVVEASNGSKKTKIVQISTLKPIVPIIDESGVYPSLTLNGVKKETGKIKIIYEENENLENYYSEDNGTTWKIYEGEFKLTSGTIMAKSVVKENPDCYTQIQVSIGGVVGAELYDGDETTGIKGNPENKNEYVRYMNINSDIIGKKIGLLVGSKSLEWCYAGINAYDAGGKLIGNDERVRSGWTSLVIPEGTRRLGIYCQNNATVYEIAIE